MDEHIRKIEEINGVPFQGFHCANTDEAGVERSQGEGLQAVVGKDRPSRRVRSQKGKHSHITVCGLVFGDGGKAPLYFIMKGERKQEYMFESGTTRIRGTIEGQGEFSLQPSAFMSDLIWEEDVTPWIIKHMRAQLPEERKKDIQILFLDGFGSHTKMYKSLREFQNAGIHLICFPSHTSADFQPLDVSVFGPFKKKLDSNYNKEGIAKFQHSNAPLDQYDLPRIIQETWNEAVPPENIISGFRATGIFPFNRNFVAENPHIFEASKIYEKKFWNENSVQEYFSDDCDIFEPFKHTVALVDSIGTIIGTGHYEPRTSIRDYTIQSDEIVIGDVVLRETSTTFTTQCGTTLLHDGSDDTRYWIAVKRNNVKRLDTKNVVLEHEDGDSPSEMPIKEIANELLLLPDCATILNEAAALVAQKAKDAGMRLGKDTISHFEGIFLFGLKAKAQSDYIFREAHTDVLADQHRARKHTTKKTELNENYSDPKVLNTDERLALGDQLTQRREEALLEKAAAANNKFEQRSTESRLIQLAHSLDKLGWDPLKNTTKVLTIKNLDSLVVHLFGVDKVTKTTEELKRLTGRKWKELSRSQQVQLLVHNLTPANPVAFVSPVTAPLGLIEEETGPLSEELVQQNANPPPVVHSLEAVSAPQGATQQDAPEPRRSSRPPKRKATSIEPDDSDDEDDEEGESDSSSDSSDDDEEERTEVEDEGEVTSPSEAPTPSLFTSKYLVGSRVQGKLRINARGKRPAVHWFYGTVVKIVDGKYHVVYDDALKNKTPQQHPMNEEDLRSLPIAPTWRVKDGVVAFWKGQLAGLPSQDPDNWFAGEITAESHDAHGNPIYSILYSDNDVEERIYAQYVAPPHFKQLLLDNQKKKDKKATDDLIITS